MGFLDLPRELRDVIYEFALRVNGAIFLYTSDPYARPPIAKAKIVRYKGEGPSSPQPLRDVIPMALMRSCRQIHAECSEVLLGTNVFNVWYLDDSWMSLVYRQLVRHVIVTASEDHRIFSNDLEEVSYWWKRRFWPTLVRHGLSNLERFPNLETLTFTIKAPRNDASWRFAFFNVKNKTPEQRINLAANWMRTRCPLEDTRLRESLQLDLVLPTILSKVDYPGSKFAPDEDEDEEEQWDPAEFTEAFERMKRLGDTSGQSSSVYVYAVPKAQESRHGHVTQITQTPLD